MARRPHLGLHRLEGELDRRKRPGFGSAPARQHEAHGARLVAEAVAVAAANAQRADFEQDPAAILQVRTAGYVGEDALANVNLRLLSQPTDDTVVVYSPDPTLAEFRQRATFYSGPIPAGQRGPAYGGTFNAVEAVDAIPAVNKIGTALRGQGCTTVDSVASLPAGFYDIELWDLEDGLEDVRLHRLETLLPELGGELLSQYRGAGLFIARVQADGNCLAELLSERVVATIDLPPEIELPPQSASDWNVVNIPPVVAPPGDAPCIGIVDSGVISGHPILAPAMSGEFGVPGRLGSDDERAHGTSVAGLAAYGSFAEQLDAGTLNAQFRIASAKVVDANGRFADEALVPSIMEEAIRRLHGEFECSVVNISLGDRLRTVGGRPSNWAMVLDNLARELDLVIVVSAGNITTGSQSIAAGGVQSYPAYMLEGDNRLLEPASAANALVVGSLAHSTGLAPNDAAFADIVSLTDEHDPSPFSRCGPGFRDSVKPDLVEYGGTAVWQGYNSTLSADRDTCGVLTLNADYPQRLLTFRFGTSFAAPAVAYKAAAIRQALPEVSANLTRALLGLSAEYPEQLLLRTALVERRGELRFAGYGVSNLGDAIESDDYRPVLVAEDSLQVDRFAVYEVPIPTDFQNVAGVRHIKVSLAFDPPVRNTRKEYLGVTMGFHLARGVDEQDVFDRFRKWEAEDREQFGEPFIFEGGAWQCKMEPIASIREAGTLQVGTFTAKRSLAQYGDRYFLVVRCEGKWATEAIDRQNFALAVQLWHEAQLELYQQVAVTLQA